MLVIEELRDGACRWPVAEFDRGEFLFCGEPVTREGKSYCACHLAIAYKPSRPAGRTIANLEAAEERRLELISIAATF
jgi:hypothetical protein